MPSDYKSITEHNKERLGSDTASRKTQVSMYSDSAHFVYEILQNADDYRATEVSFKLSKNEVVIEYDGEPFTEKHVKAITYFGKSTSREDLVKTGRFGVGFKSVFAFTANPVIISGDEHFQIYDLYRIREYPYPDSFPRFCTRIVLPFDHESEQPDFVEKLMQREEAYRQISECLTTLDMNTLLFTRHIREIRWEVDNRSACYRRKDEIDHNARLTTIAKGQHESKYLVFSKVPKWENQAYKAVEIAFSADTPDQLSPIDDDFLYVLFTTREKTGLRFILNGPYRTNPARETISKTDDFNVHLMKVTCELMQELLLCLRERKLITVQFLSVLPNNGDRLEDFYTPLRDTIVDEFQNQKLTPTKRGDHAAALGLYRYEKGLSDLIQDEDLATLLGKDRSLPLWATDPQLIQRRDERGRFVPDPNAQRVGDFLTMLDISEWTTDNFVGVLETKSEQIMEWLKGKKEDWHQDLYVLLGDFLSRASPPRSYVAHVLKTRLSNLRIVHCSDGIYRVGSECHFLGDDIEPDEDLQLDATVLEGKNQSPVQEENEHEEDFHYVAKGVYSSGGESDLQEKARNFLKEIGVREVDEAEQVKAILKQRYTKDKLHRQYYKRDLERFIELVEKESNNASLFKEYCIFERTEGMGLPPSLFFMDSPYLNTGLTTYYESGYVEFATDGRLYWGYTGFPPYYKTLDRYSDTSAKALSLEDGITFNRISLSPKYAKSGIDPERFGKFAQAVGVQTKLEAIKQTIRVEHPEYQDLVINAQGQWRYDTGRDADYTIPEFKILLDTPSIDKSRLIWRTMCSLPENCLKALYRRNQSYKQCEGHSSLVHDLRKANWVPQEEGDTIAFKCPCDALREHLPPEGFSWSRGYPHDAGEEWLDAIEFGKIAREQEAEYIQQNQHAKELGFNSGDEAEKWAKLASRKSPEEVEKWFDKSSSRERRKELLVIELSHAEEKQYEPRARSIRITRSKIDPTTHLRAQYTEMNNVECQMCRQDMPFKKRNSDEDYFEAVEALKKDYFPKEHAAQYLALCPVCAAKYKEFVKRDKKAREDLHNALKSSDEPEIRLALSDFAIRIWFKEKHWHDLKTVLYYYEKEGS